MQTLESVQARSEACRKTTSTFSQIQDTPIDQVLNQVLRQDGVTILVDWISLIPRGWDPLTEIPWPAQQQPIESTLKDIASSMNLAIRPLDDQTFELTTRDARTNATMLQVYPCGKLLEKNLSSKQILKILEDGIAPSLPKNAFTTVYFVPQYNCIVALLPHALHVRAERILNSLAGN